jgi:hypothetical protein
MASKNLIPVYRQVRDARMSRLRAWSYGAGGLLVAEALVWGALSLAPSQGVAPPPEAFSKAAAEVSKANEQAAGLRWELETVREQVSSRQFVVEQPDYSLLLAMLSQLTGDGVVLSQCELTRGAAATGSDRAQVVKMSGFARNQPAVAAFMLDLEGTGVFKTVTLLRSSEQQLMNANTAGFQVECVLGQGQKGGR